MNKSSFSPLNPTLGRAPFVVWGFLLLGIKFCLDRYLPPLFNQSHKPNLLWLGPMPDLSQVDEARYFIILAAISLPFIIIGLMLTSKRLLDANLPQWIAILFFVPYVNLFFFTYLAIHPSASEDEAAQGDLPRSKLAQMLPEPSLPSALLGYFVGTTFSLVTGLILIYGTSSYGWSLFLGIPFFNGLISSSIYGYNDNCTRWQYVQVAIIACVITGCFTFFLKVEGLLCLIMASPLALLLSILGGFFAHFIRVQGKVHPERAGVFFILLFPFTTGLDHQRVSPVFNAVTEVAINASPEVVWDNLIEFPHIDEPTELMFRAGISYPTHAVIEGRGVGSVRYCNFSTGSFVEPIKVWDPPHRLAFSVQEQPDPMTELTPFGKIDAPHLKGYFLSERGEFLLLPGENGGTRLIGTTWYKQEIWPSAYWRMWSQFIIHRIHLRVLNHIRDQAEAAHSNQKQATFTKIISCPIKNPA